MTTADDPGTRLLRASEVGACSEILELLAAGVSADGGGEPGEWTSLMRASSAGHTAAVSILVRAGADLNARWVDNDHETGLMEAAERGHVDVVSLLLDAGASPDLQDDNGESALVRAAAAGHTAVVELLIAHGANLELVDCDGNSALFRAAVWDRTGVVAMLLRAGAEIRETAFRELMLGKAVSGSTRSFLALLDAGVPVDEDLLCSLERRGCRDLVRLVRERTRAESSLA